MRREDLISDYMLRQNVGLHGRKKWGGSAFKHADAVLDWARQLGVASILDYGCGRGTLRPLLISAHHARVDEYDPAIAGKDSIMLPLYDLVVCTDVMEHVELDRVDNVLTHVRSLSVRGAYICVATRPANKTLPDGQNAHVTLRDSAWWTERVRALDWRVSSVLVRQRKEADGGGEKDVTFWLRVG